ncbi:transposase [uncultured Imperialibacter sp.]|uniref:transposase n=1 Tax=uncultured Imperialibacter sp. TaxID=1672639 RepID=UPI0030D70700
MDFPGAFKHLGSFYSRGGKTDILVPDNNKVFYRRNLPHLQPMGGLFFVTYMLHGAIPRQVNEQWRREREEELIQLMAQETKDSFAELKNIVDRKFWLKQEKYLDNRKDGPFYFKDDKLAQVAVESLFFWDNRKIEVICFCGMPNHIHAVLRTMRPDEVEGGMKVALNNIMHSIKRHSANRCNKLLNKVGRFWQEESFDRLVRDRKELSKTILYIINNPVKAGFCQSPKDWKWNYIKPDYNEFM